MRIGDIVAVDVGLGPSVLNYVGVVTRADSWNGIWVTSTRGCDGDISEVPLADFAAGGRLVDRPDLDVREAPEAEPPRRRKPFTAAMFVAMGAVAALFALRGLARLTS
jgi:hypothetical protein